MVSFERHSRLVLGVFWALAVAFLLALVSWTNFMWHLLPGNVRWFRATAFPVLLLVILVLGALLLILSVWRKSEWTNVWLRRWLLVTGAASVATGAGILLHNLLDQLAEITADWTLISSAANALSVVFFFVGIMSPFVFVAAILVTAVLVVRK